MKNIISLTAAILAFIMLTACSQPKVPLSTDGDTATTTSTTITATVGTTKTAAMTTTLSTTITATSTNPSVARSTTVTTAAPNTTPTTTTIKTTSATTTPKTTDDDPETIDQGKENGTDVKAEEVPTKENRSNGIDVSKWQGKIDWQKVKQSGVEFALVRIGYRGENGVIHKDENADYNLQQAEKVGVLTGVYFFSTATTEKEAIEEAAFTVNAVANYSISYPIVYDCEGYTNPKSRMYALTAAQRTANACAFLNAVKKAGYDTMFYGALGEIANPAYWELSKISAQHKIWVAQYPDVTYPQKDTPDHTGRFDAWQYTNKGSVDGVDGDTDMVVCYFKRTKAAPKNTVSKTTAATAPLTEEEKLYAPVEETVTAKQITNLRAAATTDSAILATIKNGETVTRVGVGTNGWSKLVYNGKTVYAVSSYLTTDLTVKTTTTTDGFTAVDEQVTAKEITNLRTAPSTENSEIIYTLKNGEYITRIGVHANGWSKLLYNGQTVYAISSYLLTK